MRDSAVTIRGGPAPRPFARAGRHLPALCALLAALSFAPAAIAQQEPAQQESAQQDRGPRTRAELIEMERREKIARLWPERQSPIAQMANGFVERGLLEGVRSGLGGGNGVQFTLGGMRSGQGAAFGVGYRRSDLFDDRFGFRATVRGTADLAWMTDVQLYFPPLQSRRGFLDIYGRYEYSPQMDYYGEGPDSEKQDRSSYRLEDYYMWVRGGWAFWKYLRIGGQIGGYNAKTGPGKRSGVPSIEDEFDPASVPGLFVDGNFYQTGLFVQFDWRDNPGGPRYGGNYKLEWTKFWDLEETDQYNFWKIDGIIDQYWPYANRTRVFALHIQGTYTFVREGQEVPFYLQPTLGGNDDLRGFERYRFYANNRFYVTLEHRWFSFAGLDMAVFVDAGKVANNARLLYREDMRYDGGIGFRFKFEETVIMRIDQAYGNEGYRFMWTFNNIF
ncbi:MAG: hypothetical protein PVJ51_00160 [Acidobacteriota bacterium]|jgi:hypothetical protein